MLPAPWHTRPLRPSWHVGLGSRGQAPDRRQTSLRSVAVGAACVMAIDPKVKPSAIFHRLQRLAHPRPRWRWAVPLRLRPLRMTDLSAGECLVRLTDRADTPYSRLLRSLTSSSSSLQGRGQASLPSVLASFVSFRSALRFAASSTVHHLRFKAVC